jgi:hypothetical protein
VVRIVGRIKSEEFSTKLNRVGTIGKVCSVTLGVALKKNSVKKKKFEKFFTQL